MQKISTKTFLHDMIFRNRIGFSGTRVYPSGDEPFWKIFSDKQPQLIKNGGWHFSFLKDPKSIRKKIISYAHQEFNKEKFNNIIYNRIAQN